MDISDQIEREEGRVKTVYLDSLGFQTIGVGRLVDKRKGGAGLRDSEIDFMKSNDINEKTEEVLQAAPWAAGLDPARMAVLIQMAFQLGIVGLLNFHNTLAAVQGKRWGEASNGMLASTWAEQTPLRVKRLAQQMLTGEWV